MQMIVPTAGFEARFVQAKLRASPPELGLLLVKRRVGLGDINCIERLSSPKPGLVRVGKKDVHYRASFVLGGAVHEAREMFVATVARHEHDRVIQVCMQFMFSRGGERHIQYFFVRQGVLGNGIGFTSRRVVRKYRVGPKIISQRIRSHLNPRFRGFKESKLLPGICQLSSGSSQLGLRLLKLFSELTNNLVIAVRVTAKSNRNGKYKSNQKSYRHPRTACCHRRPPL